MFAGKIFVEKLIITTVLCSNGKQHNQNIPERTTQLWWLISTKIYEMNKETLSSLSCDTNQPIKVWSVPLRSSRWLLRSLIWPRLTEHFCDANKVSADNVLLLSPIVDTRQICTYSDFKPRRKRCTIWRGKFLNVFTLHFLGPKGGEQMQKN